METKLESKVSSQLAAQLCQYISSCQLTAAKEMLRQNPSLLNTAGGRFNSPPLVSAVACLAAREHSQNTQKFLDFILMLLGNKDVDLTLTLI
jgi:hypothetical protein